MAVHPRVTVVVPSLNQGRYIRQTIDSILAQDHPDIEVIVADGGSQDDTVDILRSYGPRITWWSRADGGQAAAINMALESSSGLILTWLNSDDTYLPGAISTAVQVFDANPGAGLVYGNAVFTDADNRIQFVTALRPFDFLALVVDFRNPICQPASFFSREAWRQSGGLNPAYHYFLDWDLWLRIGAVWPVVFTPGVLASYRLHSKSKTGKADYPAHELAWIYDNFWGGVVPPSVRGARSASKIAMLQRTAEYYRASGASNKALRARFEAWKESWTNRLLGGDRG